MGANKGRRAKNLFKSYYVALDNKAMAEYPSAPEIIEKHVYYHPDKGIEKTVYYPDAHDSPGIPEGMEQRISHPTVRKEEHDPSTEVGKRVGSIHLGSANTSPRDCSQRSLPVQEPVPVDRHPEGPTAVQEPTRAVETLTRSGNLGEPNARVDAASAFQRWRQVHLQRTFNQELRKVSENSRKDEASMTMVEQGRAQREKSLAYALAESASLSAQLSAKEQEIRALQSHRPVEDLQNLPDRATSAMELEAEASDRRIHQPPETRQVSSREEDLVWINEPQVHAHNQEFAVLSHHLRELMGEIISLEHRAGDLVSFSEVYEAIRNIEQGLDLKMKGKLRRPSRRGSDSWHPPVEDVDYSGKRNFRTSSQNEFRSERSMTEQQRRNKTPKNQISQYEQERDKEAFYRANNVSKLDKIGKSVVWKWRWALAASKAKTLSRHLKSLKSLYKAHLSRSTYAEASGSSVSNQELTESGRLKSSMEKELMSIIPGYSLVSFIVSLWRAYSLCTKTQKTFLSRLIPIDRIMAAFPLWVEKVGDRQVLLYFFSLWQLASLKRGRKRGTSWSPRRSPRRRNTTTTTTTTTTQELGPSIYESFHHCCHPNSPSEANRCSPTRMRTPRSPSEVKSSRPVRPRQPARTRRGQQDAEDEETDSNARCIPVSGGHEAEANRAALAGECVSNVNEESPSSSFETVGMSEMFQVNAPIPLTGQTFSAQALRKLQLQLQHELQDMQPILAKATKAIQNQIVVNQNGKYANDSKRANSMASLWKICSTVEYALTEARNQMLSIIHDSARVYHNGVEELDHEQMLPPEESLCVEVERVTSAVPSSRAQPMQESAPAGKSYGGFQSVFNLLSKTSGLQSLRRKSCLAAQYAVGLNHKIHHLKDSHRRGWQ